MSTTLVLDPPRTAAPIPTPPAARPSRLQSIDLLRGLVMVVMAIDHVRDFSGVPSSGPTAGIFFTRWITHFSAPAFSFFAGTAIFFNARKVNDRAALTRFLLERGALLILLDFTVMRAGWTFNFDYAHQVHASVLWALGWSMIIMAGLIRIPARQLGLLGLGLIFGQELIPLVHGLLPVDVQAATTPFWQVLYDGGSLHYGASGDFFLRYSLVPWVGVMAAGYGFGVIMLMEEESRDLLALQIGLTATVLFILIAGYQMLGHAAGVDDIPGYMRFLGQRKYPASELFLLMTLGPTIALIPFVEHLRGWAARTLVMFGRVPMFFYVIHIPLAHLLALGVSYLRTGHVDPWLFSNFPLGTPPVPDGYAWGLPTVYLTWATLIVVLYFACRWYAGVKARHPGSWLRYF